jgi:hypothetical protein
MHLERPREKGSPFFRKARAKANQTKAKVRTAMEKAMVRIRRANRKARFLERLMQTLAAIVEKQDTGKRTATRRRTTCRYDRLKRLILRHGPQFWNCRFNNSGSSHSDA